MKKIICVLAVVTVIFVLCGCSLSEQLQQWKNGTETTATDGVSAAAETPSAASTSDQLVVSLEEDEPTLTDENSREVVLFFADSNGGKLKKELRRILKSEGLAKSTLEELLKGPKENALKSVLPQGTRLLSLNVKDGLATADFSGDLQKAVGSTGELLAVYAIVNTLTQFNSVEQVQLLIDGKKVDTLSGHVDISQPLTRDISLVSE